MFIWPNPRHELPDNHDPVVQGWIREFTEPGDVFWDVGAHYGIMSDVARSAGARTCVMIEACPATYVALVEKFVEVPRMYLICGAASDSTNPLELSLHRAFAGITRAGAPVCDCCTEWQRLPARVMAAGVRIADLIGHGLPAPNVFKMDIEGGETRAFRGAALALTSARAGIIEYDNHAASHHGGSLRELDAAIAAARFRVAKVDGTNALLLPA